VAFAVTTPSGTPMVDSFEWVERFIRCFGSPNLIYDRKRLLCADSVAKVFLSRRAKIYGAAAAFRAATF